MAKWLTAMAPTGAARAVEVDREAKVLKGYVVAQEGAFKSGRGEFDGNSLKAIVQQMNAAPQGLKSRFSHPDLSSDGLGKFLGRARSPRLSKVGDVGVVRADLHFADSAYVTPSGDLATYVMDLAGEDPDALSSSLVIEPAEEYRLNRDGTPKLGEDGNALPPLWIPIQLHASDIVDTGDAVDGLLSAQLSADGLPDEVVRNAAALLRGQFGDKDREFVEPRLLSWVQTVLDHYWPADTSDSLEAELAEVELFALKHGMR